MTIGGVTQVGGVTIQASGRSLRIQPATQIGYVVSNSSVEGGLVVIDLDSPYTMSVLGTLAMDSLLRDIRCSTLRTGNYVHVVGHNNGNGVFASIDVSNPAAMSIVGRITSSNYFGENACIRIGNTVFSCGNNLTATDVSTVASPSITSNTSFTAQLSICSHIEDMGSNVVMVCGSGIPAYVGFYNVANPASMAFLGEVALGASFTGPRGVATHPSASVTYVACGGVGAGGVVAIDHTSYAAPTVAWFDSTGAQQYVDALVTADGSTLIVGGLNRLRFYSLANPMSPVFLFAYHRDDQGPPNNRNILDVGGSYGMAMKDGSGSEFFVLGDASTVVGFVLATLGGWQVGSVAL